MSWQQSARLGIALAGGACAAAVLLTLGTREVPPPPAAPERVDPSAVIETAGASLQQLSHGGPGGPGRREYALQAARHLTYEDGTTRFVGGVEASVRDEEGPDFRITADEAVAAASGADVEFSGAVMVAVPGGFDLTAEQLVLGSDSGLLTTDGPTAFAREGLSGEGVGLTYDTSRETLIVERAARGTLLDPAGARIEFTADSITFDRSRRLLHLAGAADVVRDGDRLTAERVDVELDERATRATFIALRGRAGMRAPAGALEALSAEAIDLDYGADGARLERVNLAGEGTVRLAPGEDAPAGREIRGASIEAILDGAQALARLEATGGVALTLPQASGPAFTILADGVDVRAEAGVLRTAGFVGDVVFEEAGGADRGRRATSGSLTLEFSGGTVALAVFIGAARFDAGDVAATGPEAHYRPGDGSLSLRGEADNLPPRITAEALSVEAASIDVALESLRVAAEGAVQTTLAAPAAGSASRLPGLLETDTAVNVSADAFVYEGAGAAVTYTGDAVLWQDETSIRGDAIVLDQASGDFRVTGRGQSTLRLDGELSVGAAPVIRYDEAARELSYTGLDGPVVPGPTGGGARLSGPQGDLTAGRIVVRLDVGGGVTGLDADADVRLLLDPRTATGRGLTHDARTGAYVLSGAPGAPATLVDGCRRTEGQTLTFLAEGDRVTVDGDENVRTRAAGASCAEPAAP
jgi:lipopolysaccharide export system protein LptA